MPLGRVIGGMLGQKVFATTKVAVGNAYVARPDQGGRQMDQHASDRIRATSGWRSMLRTSEGGGGKDKNMHIEPRYSAARLPGISILDRRTTEARYPRFEI